jgi:hypothetical protein
MANARQASVIASCGHEVQLDVFTLPGSKQMALEWIRRQMSRPCGPCRTIEANASQAILSVFLNALGSSVSKKKKKRYHFPNDTTVSLNRGPDGKWSGELRYGLTVFAAESDDMLGVCRKLCQKHLEARGLDKAFL